MVFQRMKYRPDCIETLRAIYDQVGMGKFCTPELGVAINWHHINTLKSYEFIRKTSSRHKIRYAIKGGGSGVKEVNQWVITERGLNYLKLKGLVTA